MKVRRVYIIGFQSLTGQKETEEVVSGLETKYNGKGVEVRKAILDTSGKEAEWSNQSGWKECFGSELDVKDYGTAKGEGVGAYFVFHASPHASEQPPEVLGKLISILMDKHPKGQLRKIVVLACAYAYTSPQQPFKVNSSLFAIFNPGLYDPPSHLQTLAKHIQSRYPDAKANWPKMIAAWKEFISFDSDKQAKVAKGLPGSEYGRKKPAKKLAKEFKVYYLLNDGVYQRHQVTGDQDPTWHDNCEIATTPDGKTAVVNVEIPDPKAEQQ